MIDYCAAHKQPADRAWIAANPRVKALDPDPDPDLGIWLNLGEC